MVTFIDLNHSSSVSAMSYLNGNWNYIGPSGFSNALGSNCAITTYQNLPYVMYRDGAVANKSTVRFYNSTVSFDELINTPGSFYMYPNPAKDLITIDVSDNNNGQTILCIYNIFGSIIKTESLNQNQGSINISDLSNGLYIVTINSKALTLNQKLIIQR
jgi:hypothetical protein